MDSHVCHFRARGNPVRSGGAWAMVGSFVPLAVFRTWYGGVLTRCRALRQNLEQGLRYVDIRNVDLEDFLETHYLTHRLFEVILGGCCTCQLHDTFPDGADLQARAVEQVLHVVLDVIVLFEEWVYLLVACIRVDVDVVARVPRVWGVAVVLPILARLQILLRAGIVTVLWLGDELAFVLEIFFVLVVDVVGGVVVFRFRFVTCVVAGLFVRSVGLEGREVGVRVEGEVHDGNLQPFSPLRLDDDVGDLAALLVFYQIGDAADLATVRRPRLEPDETSFLQVVLRSSFLPFGKIYPVPEGLLRQLGQDLGHPVEIGVQGLLFAYHLFERHALDARAFDPDHHPGLSVGERLDRRRPEPACEDPVRCRRNPTALDVAYDREPRVVSALRLVYVLVQLLGG